MPPTHTPPTFPPFRVSRWAQSLLSPVNNNIFGGFWNLVTAYSGREGIETHGRSGPMQWGVK